LELADMTDKDYEDALRLQRVTGLLKLRTPSPAAGGYRMGDEENGGWILFSLPKKPCWAHRMGVRLVLGWKWVDA
jgi:hypothetical protein